MGNIPNDIADVKVRIAAQNFVVVICSDALRSFDDLRSLPIDHSVGRGHGFDHEGRR